MAARAQDDALEKSPQRKGRINRNAFQGSARRRNPGEPVPAGYVSLLRITNGVQINGAHFKEAENLVAENLDMPRREIIVLGTEGNMVEYVFGKQDRRFHTINMGFPDERFASYDTFGDMLLAVIREQCGL